MSLPTFILAVTGKLKNDYLRLNAHFATIKTLWDGHVAGTADKHAAQHITYTGLASGTEVKTALNSLKSDINNVAAGGAEHDALVTAAFVDSEGVDFGAGGLGTYLDGRLNKWEIQTSAQLADTAQQVNNLMSQLAIQTILNNSKNVNFKAGNYPVSVISGIGYVTHSGQEISFDIGAILQVIGTNLENYQVIGINDVEDVELNNPVVIGERLTHIGITGEWGFGIAINNSKHITINNPVCSNCWGDGIYLGNLNENIVINNPICDNNRRQGISVISCKGGLITNPVCSNTNGTLPMSGIDIEPNVGSSGIENFVITNPRTLNNAGAGITIALGTLVDTGKIIDITITGHKDDESKYGLYIGGLVGVLRGSVLIDVPIYTNSKNSGIYARNYSSDGPRVEIRSPKIINANRTLISSTKYDSGILVSRDPSDSGSASDLGNIHIFNPSIICDDLATKTAIYLSDSTAGKIMKKCSLIDPVVISSAISFGLGHNVETFNFSDKFEQLKKSTATSLTLHGGNGYSVIDNTGAVAAINLVLSADIIIGCEVELRITAPFAVNVLVGATEFVLPQGTIVGKGIISSAVGSRVKLKKVSTTAWHIVSMIGTWTNQV